MSSAKAFAFVSGVLLLPALASAQTVGAPAPQAPPAVEQMLATALQLQTTADSLVRLATQIYAADKDAKAKDLAEQIEGLRKQLPEVKKP